MAPSVERTAELAAPASWRVIDFISDLHLAEDTPRTFTAWADYLRATPADAVLILGDLFEAWVGDDASAEGFEASGAAVLADASSRRAMGFMVGNRDFLVGTRLLEACGVIALADPTVITAFDQRVLLAHGDAMCIADLPYQRFRRQVRSAEWQRAFLDRPLAERRAIARNLRSESQRQRVAAAPWIDVDTATALDAMRTANAAVLVHGHTHRPATEALASGYRREVLSDWDFDHGLASRGEVLRWQAEGFTRLTPSAAASRP